MDMDMEMGTMNRFYEEHIAPYGRKGRTTERQVKYNAWRFACTVDGVEVAETYTGFPRKTARRMFDDLICEKMRTPAPVGG